MKTRRNLTLVVFAVAALMGVFSWIGGPALLPQSNAQSVEEGEHHDDHDSDACTCCPGEDQHDDDHPAGEECHDDHDGEEEHDGHDEHAEEGHDEHDGEGHDEHAEEGHDDHADHDGEAEKLSTPMTPGQMQKYGIVLSEAGPGLLQKHVRLPGEIVLNADRAAHVVPPAPGIVREVLAKVGDSVQPGDAMAWIESSELAEARADYMAKFNEVSCCSIDLTRAEAIRRNTLDLLALLANSPTLDDLTDLEPTQMGENRSSLISAYAQWIFTRQVFEREKELLAQDISSRSDYQKAEAAYKKAHAAYLGVRDSVDFETSRAELEAQRTQRNTQLTLKAAERKLYVLGLTAADLESPRPAPATASPAHECNDPNCTDCVAEQAAPTPAEEEDPDEKLGWYALRAPFAGVVTAKHIVLGEKVGDDTDAFMVADLSNVWVDLSVYQKELPHVRESQDVQIVVGDQIPVANGKISFVSPVVDATTRTALARVVLPNPDGAYRPGLFVTAEVAVFSSRVRVLVPAEAVQQIEESTVVFVPDADGLEPRAVTLGRSSRTHVEITSGLKPGERYVSEGAFQLKAAIVTAGLGAHAGHGH